MSLEKDLFKAYRKTIKDKDLFKALNKSTKSISKSSAFAIKQSEELRLNRKTQDKIIKDYLKSLNWLRPLFIQE